LVKNLREAVQSGLSLKRRHLAVSLRIDAPSEEAAVARKVSDPKAPLSRPISKAVLHTTEVAKQRQEQKAEIFAIVQKLRAEDLTVSQIARRLHLNRRRFDKWLKWGEVPERSRMEPRPGLAESFREYLWERWTAGYRNGRALLAEIRNRGYVGSYSWLAHLLSKWRHTTAKANGANALPAILPTAELKKRTTIVDPVQRQISPQIAAALSTKFRKDLKRTAGRNSRSLESELPRVLCDANVSFKLSIYSSKWQSEYSSRLDGKSPDIRLAFATTIRAQTKARLACS
jgi:hypothetical protein